MHCVTQEMGTEGMEMPVQSSLLSHAVVLQVKAIRVGEMSMEGKDSCGLAGT